MAKSTKNRPSYERIHLLPYLIADTVAKRQYTGSEWSPQVRCQSNVDKTEALRLKMTQDSISEFAEWCDLRCKRAYDARCDWFIQICDTGSRGRDELYNVISHWLASFLSTPERPKRDLAEAREKGEWPALTGAAS